MRRKMVSPPLASVPRAAACQEHRKSPHPKGAHLKTKLSVCFVEADPALRKSLQQAAKAAGYGSEAFADAGDFLAEFDAKIIFCIVIDAHLPGMSGLRLLEVFQARRIYVPVIFLTGHSDVSLAVEALKNGAQDVLTKPVKADSLADKLDSAHKLYADWKRIEDERRKIARRIETLTPRELEVLDLMVAGMKNTAIAKRLGISRKTLDIHRWKVIDKMAARTWADLVRWRLLHESGPGGRVVMKPGGYV
jgi:FixJ family two-component response regulator